MRARHRSFAVIGLGSFGSTVATALAGSGDDVVGIDIDETRVRQHADDLSQALIIDARDEDALAEAGLAEHDVVLVAIGEDLEASVICTMNLKLIGAKCIWVKAFSKTHHRILSRLGADRVIQPERDTGLHVAETLHSPFVSDFMSLGNGFHVVNIVIDEEIAGRKIGDLGKTDGETLRVVGVMRGARSIECREDLTLEENDRLLLLGRRNDLRRFTGQF
ncbi:TrkA family potassium uptake protein [Aurantimonas sp. VKM B-3413]|uniref:potassium channel family protein n=1 Tax=Aurantimonas sp. VKM B-3413 TaxID=2779401 RepID=UPI001E4565C9|nr:TrkA family potassium uptake protein [Aurantimonas sp. VKM B-3413]MCB8837395.1 TrkA family potassium uptake protein [Aurantimonas sp. VKM B-3413]